MGTCTSTYNCSGCQGCNRCNSCNSCQGAENTCNDDICNTCNATCDRCNSICQSSGQLVGSFSFNECISSSEIFINASAWKNLITYIQNAYARGSVRSGGDPGLSSDNINVKSGDPMKATMYQNVASALNGLGKTDDGSSISNEGIQSGNVIYGTYFTNIQDYSTKWKLKNEQCNNNCNVTCDGCNSCEATCKDCNNCNNCNSSCNNECNSCNSCEGCLGSCETSCESSCQDACQQSCQTNNPEPKE